MSKRAVLSGAAGFAGIHLTKHLLEHGYEVLALLRPGSEHNERVEALASNYPLKILYADMANEEPVERLGAYGRYDVFFHLAWQGGRDDMAAQTANISYTLRALFAAKELGCARFVATGSQAEYGLCDGIITESTETKPYSAYGAAKLSACHLSRVLSAQLGIEWIWGRIFSLTGAYEPAARMLPELVNTLRAGGEIELSDCTQNWDYLDAADCAEALIALAERGRSGEIYNIAHGAYRPLKSYVEEARSLIGSGSVVYGKKAEPYVSLAPSVDKLKADTGWKPAVAFTESIGSIYDI